MKNFIVLLIFSYGLSLYSNSELFPFGMNNTVYSEFNESEYAKNCTLYVRTIDSAASIGIKWWRGMNKFTWLSVEPAKGTYDWSNEDSLVKWTGERGIHIIPVIGYMYPKWAHQPGIPEEYWEEYPFYSVYWDEYKNFIEAMAERYDGDGTADMPGLKIPIKYWECMNEPYDKANFLGDLGQYAEIFDSTRKALKKADPEAKLGGPCLIATRNNYSIWESYDAINDTIKKDSMITTEMLSNIIDSIGSENIDFITHHIYEDPGIFMERLRNVRNTVETSIGNSIPIWITECGYLWYQWWHHPYKSGNPADSNVFDNKWSFYYDYYPKGDTILIGDTAQIYWVDTVSYHNDSTQAFKYSVLLDSIDALLNENPNYKFFFFDVNVLTQGVDGLTGERRYDTIYKTSCGGGVCSLWVHKFVVNDPLWDEHVSRCLSILRRNFNPLPAFYTIRDSILKPEDQTLPSTIVNTGQTKSYQAMNSITTGNFEIKNGGTVAMEAGQNIYLGAGFKLEEGGYFYGSTNPRYGGGDMGMSLMKSISIPNAIKTSAESTSREDSIPKVFSCSQNSPNPFNINTTIRYGLPKSSKVSLCIYNLVGQKVKTLVDAQQSAGYKSVSWDGRTSDGKNVPQGIYFYKFQAGDDFRKTYKMIVVR
jgi:hypothetical protein